MVGRQRRRRELDDLPMGPSDDDLLQWGRDLASGSFWDGSDDALGAEAKPAAPEPERVDVESEPERVAVEPAPDTAVIDAEVLDAEVLDPVAWLAEEVLRADGPAEEALPAEEVPSPEEQVAAEARRESALRWADSIEPWERAPLVLEPAPDPSLRVDQEPAPTPRREPIRAVSSAPARAPGARSIPLVARGRRVRPVIRTSSVGHPPRAANGIAARADRPSRTEPLRPANGELRRRLSELGDD